MSSKGACHIPMRTFSVLVPINVGRVHPPEEEVRRFREREKEAEQAVRPLAGGLTKLVDHYSRGDHPYRSLMDRLAPAAPKRSDDEKSVYLPIHRSRLRAWLCTPHFPNSASLTLPTRDVLPTWERDKIAANFCLSHLRPGGYLHGRIDVPKDDGLQHHGLQQFCLELHQRMTTPDALMRSVLDDKRLPENLSKEFDAAQEPIAAWTFATTVWMFARDEDVDPWKTRCLEQARRQFPEGSWIPEWARG